MSIQKAFAFFSLLFLLLISLFSAQDILRNGLTKTTLLDEFSPDDPQLIDYLNYKKHFDYEKEISLLIQKNDQTNFELEEIEILDLHLETLLKKQTGIAKYTILSNLKLPAFDLNSKTVSMQAISENNKINPSLFSKLRELKSFQNYPLSENKKSYLIALTLKDLSRTDSASQTKALFQLLRDFNQADDYHMSIIGVEPFRFSIYDEVYRGYFLLLPLILILMFLVSFFIFKNKESIFLIFITLGFSFLSTASIIYLIDRHFSPFSSFSLLFVFVVGTSDIIHFLSDLRQSKSIEATLRSIYKPCFLTSLTTFIGLISLILSPFHTLYAFGLYGAIGIGVCFIGTFHVLPEILKLNSFQNFSKSITNSHTHALKLRPNFLLRVIKKPKYVFSFSLFLIMILIFGVSQLKFEDDFYRKFTSDHPISHAVVQIEKDFTGLGTIDLIYDKEKMDELTLKRLLNQISTLSEIHSIESVLNVKSDLENLIPTSEIANKLYHYLPLLEMPYGFHSKLNPAKQRVIIKLKNFTMETVESTQNQIKTMIHNIGLTNIQIAGFSLIRTHFVKTLKESYLESLKFSFVLIFIVFLFTFKSFKYALLAMLPNLAPVLAIGACMGFFHISADMNLPLICSVTLGLSVDDTIHFFYQFRHFRNLGHSIPDSITHSLSKVGLALIATSLLLSVSLLIFTLGKIQLFSQLGILISISSFIALMFDLIVFPALLIHFSKES